MDILDFLKKKFGNEVVLETNIYELVQDSISRVELLFEIEQISGIKVSGDDILDAETVGDVIKLINSSCKK